MPQSVDLGPSVIGICVSMAGASALFLGLRLYCKITRRRSLWWDDYVLIAAWICLAISVALAVYDVTLGLGKDISGVDQSKVVQASLVGNIIGVSAVFAAAWSKTSFALTLLRLSQGWMTKVIWLIIISINIVMTMVIVLSFLKCTPVGKVWNSKLPGTCWNPMVATVYNIFAGGFSGVMDLLLCVLAWIIIWKLQIQVQEKIGIGVALTFGLFAAASAGVKCHRMLMLGSPNRTLAGVGIITWGLIESAVTIMAASIPMMRVLVLNFRRHDPDHVSTTPLRKIRIISARSNGNSLETAMSEVASAGPHAREIE